MTRRSEVRLFKALAHPVRLQILDILCQDDECVCHLCALIGRSQPYVSQQLAVLREAGLVEDLRTGQHTYYRVRDRRLAELRALVQDMAGIPREEITAQGPRAYPLEGCHCPRCREARQVQSTAGLHLRSRAPK